MKGQEVIEEIVPAKCVADATGVEKFRREAAKDILCSMVRGGYGRGREKEQAKLAVAYADELIKRLWEDKEI